MKRSETAGIILTPAEWNVMEVLWISSPCTVMQLATQLKSRAGWAKSTSMTMISRMEKKGLICCNPQEKPKHYVPCVQREDAVEQETRSFLNRVFHGSVKLMLNTAVEQLDLTEEERRELYAILDKAKEE